MITDFGNAVLEQGTLLFTETMSAPQFTPRWTVRMVKYKRVLVIDMRCNQAPELLDDGPKQSQEADVYALGMEIITGKVPYCEKTSIGAVVKAIVTGQIPARPEAHIPSNSQDGDALWSLLKDCWATEPKERPRGSYVAGRMMEVTSEGLVCVPDEPSSA
ncbi:hypothetical protein FRC06_004082 [Ceratobasidium sp. 370]|nr:hypothetical protein FRC06_004082 [Ceratobasidium sp. 370]